MRHANLPNHFYVNVKNEFLGPKMPAGTTKAIWHGVYCRPGQILMAHVLLESGAHWSGLPLHAMSMSDNFDRGPFELMPWAAMGDDIEAFKIEYLHGLACVVRKPFEEPGRHTGVMIDWSDGFSEYPEEHKPLNLIVLQSGQFALVPNNFVYFRDKHFVDDRAKEHMKHYLRGSKIYWEE